MARPYRLRTFLRYADENLLKQYLEAKGIKPTVLQRDEKEDQGKYWERILRSLSEDVLNRVELDFREINDMSDEAGILDLIEFAKQAGIENFPAEIENLEDHQNQALHCYLKYREVFETAAVMHHISELTFKIERTGLKIRSISEVTGQNAALTQTLSAYLDHEDGRGRHCQVDVYVDGNRVCFIANPEDYIKTVLHYKDGKLEKTSRRPVFEIVFVYHADCGRLELRAKGGAKRNLALMKLFNTVVLQDESPIDDVQKIYELNKLLDRNFSLSTELEDNVEYVFIKQLRLSFKFDNKHRVTLEVNEKEGQKPIHDLLAKYGINDKAYHVTQATVCFKFEGKGRKGSVNMIITWPDKCNLNETPLHLKAKKYLTLWGLEAPIAKPTTV